MQRREILASPVYRGLHTPVLLGGVPHAAAVLNGTLTAVLFRATWHWEVLVVGIALHLIAQRLTKKDPLWVAVARLYWRKRRYYEVR